MKQRKHKRIRGRVFPSNIEQLRPVLSQIGIDLSDEPLGPYQPWEARLLSTVNSILANRLSTEKDAVIQALGQYKLFCYWLESHLPELIKDNPGASGRLLMSIAAQNFSTQMMLWAQRQAGEEQGTDTGTGRERAAW